MIKNKSYIYIFFLFILGAISHWRWFFSYGVLTSGDWGFYWLETMKDFSKSSLFWINYSNLGDITEMSFFYPIKYLFGLLSKFNVSFIYSERILFFLPVVIFSTLSSFLLVKKIIKSNIAGFVGSLIYCFNTYFLVIQNGHLTISMAYSLFPLVFYFFIKTLDKSSYSYSIISAITLLILGIYELRIAYITGFVLLLYFIYHLLIESNWSFLKKKISIVLTFGLLFILLNSYWVLGYFSLYTNSTERRIANSALFGNEYLNIFYAFNLMHPFWKDGIIYPFINQTIPFYLWLLPIFVFLSLFFYKQNKRILFFALISLLGILLSKQVDSPFPHLYDWLFQNFPGFWMFREASKFYILIALGYSILIGAFIARLYQSWVKTKWQIYGKYFLTFLISFIFLWNTKALITGEIGGLFVPRYIHNDYLILKNFILEQRDYFRTFWIPRDSRFSIYTNNHPKVSNVNIIESNWKSFTVYEKYGRTLPFQKRISDVFKKPFSNNLFDVSSIKYVIIPIQDIENDDDFFIYYGGENNPGIRNWYVSQLDKVEWLKKIDIGTKELAIYENKDYKPHIYTTQEIETVHQNIPYNKVRFEQKNPTEYKIFLKNVSQPIYLNFSESYHPQWKVRVGKFKWYQAFGKNYFLDDKTHLKNDAALNSFYIDPKSVCQQFTCIQNSDGSYNLNLTLYFKPQSYVYLGLIGSGITFIGCIGYLIFNAIQYGFLASKDKYKTLTSL